MCFCQLRGHNQAIMCLTVLKLPTKTSIESKPNPKTEGQKAAMSDLNTPETDSSTASSDDGAVYLALSGSRDRNLCLWNLQTGSSEMTVRAHDGGVKFCSIVHNGDGKRVEDGAQKGASACSLVSGSAGHNTGNAMKFWAVT